MAKERVSGYHSSLSTPFSPMPKNFHLPIETAVLVPSTTAKSRLISSEAFQKRINETDRFLSNTLGGYTSVRGVGGYVSNKKSLIKEKIVVVYSYGERKRFLDNRKKIESWLFKKKHEWGQESLGFIYETDLYYF